MVCVGLFETWRIVMECVSNRRIVMECPRMFGMWQIVVKCVGISWIVTDSGGIFWNIRNVADSDRICCMSWNVTDSAGMCWNVFNSGRMY